MKISKCKVIWSIKSRIFKQKTVLTKISLNSHSTKKRSQIRHPYRFMNLDFLAHFGILVNRSLSSAPRSKTFLTFGTYLVNYCHPNIEVYSNNSVPSCLKNQVYFSKINVCYMGYMYIPWTAGAKKDNQWQAHVTNGRGE